MKQWVDHYGVPLFMLMLAAGLMMIAHHDQNHDLNTFAIGVGGGGLTQLTKEFGQAAVNKITGGPVSITQTAADKGTGTVAETES